MVKWAGQHGEIGQKHGGIGWTKKEKMIQPLMIHPPLTLDDLSSPQTMPLI
jgi:hypothetical protein